MFLGPFLFYESLWRMKTISKTSRALTQQEFSYDVQFFCEIASPINIGWIVINVSDTTTSCHVRSQLCVALLVVDRALLVACPEGARAASVSIFYSLSTLLPFGIKYV